MGRGARCVVIRPRCAMPDARPGETHTLVVPEDVEEMITLFQVNGIMLYVDPDGNALGYEDVFSKIAMCRKHYEECGLGADYVERFIR